MAPGRSAVLSRRSGVRAAGVAQDAQEVGEVAVALHEAGPAQHALERLLDEILGVLA